MTLWLLPLSAAVSQAAVRPPAVPLVSVEPHFSVWSAADRLYDKDTTHWSGVAQPLKWHLSVMVTWVTKARFMCPS